MKNFRLLLVSIAFSFLPIVPSFASDAQIVNIEIKESYANLLVWAELESAFTDEVKEALQSGTPITFSYHIDLKRTRTFLWDEKEAEISIHKIVKYDSFAKEYNALQIISEEAPDIEDFEKELSKIKTQNRDTLFGEVNKSASESGDSYLSVKSIGALEEWLSNIKRVVITDTLSLQKEQRYYIEVQAEMNAPGLSSPFRYIFFFVSSPDFSTRWENSTAFVINEPNTPIKRMLGKNSQ